MASARPKRRVSPRLFSSIARRIAALHSAILGLLLAAPTLASGQVAPAEAPARTQYVLEARLDPAAHRIEGAARIQLVNTASAPIEELVLYLYANAFESGETVFAREGGFGLRNLRLERKGGIELSELSSGAGEDLLARADDQLVPGDRTRIRVPLSSPVAPGATLELRARFVVRLPSLVARMGQAGDFVMAAQWFPKLAKLLPDGTFRSTPYHGAGEFDADFADYDLTVHAPPGYVIAAPGERAGVAGASARSTERYRLERARDIAWAAAPDLEVTSAQASGTLTVEAFAPRGARGLADRQAQLAARALLELGSLLGPYPHERLALVIPPPGAAGSAGMEYPGLIVGWAADPWSRLFPFAGLHDVVTTHEVAHQWFPMLVASNEVEDPVLDEGLAEWLGLHLLRDREREVWAERLTGLPLDAFELAAVMLVAEEPAPSSWLRVDQISLSQLAGAMYLRPAVVLEALAEQRGRERVLRMLGRYARDHRYRHVTPPDLERALDAEYGAGFSARTFTPALAGEGDELEQLAREPDEAAAAKALPARLLAWAQLALSWMAL